MQHSCSHYKCVLQPRLPKHHVAAKRRNSQNTSNQHLHCKLRRAQPAPAAHTRYPSSPPAATLTLHRKTQGFARRLPLQHSCSHYKCVLQPRLPKHHVTAKRRNSQNTSNQHLHCELRRARPAPAAHTRYPTPPPAAASHGKTEGPMLHAAITMRFAAKASEAPCHC